MKRTRTDKERILDESTLQREDVWHRIVVGMFKRHINRVAKCALGRAFERGQIDSHTFHEICAIVDSLLFPPNDDHKVIQKGNICYGDMAGRDINKRALTPDDQ